MRRKPACGPTRLKNAEYERVLKFDLSTRGAQHGRPVQSAHARADVRTGRARHQPARWKNEPGQMPDGAVIIAAITSCTNTNNPRNMIAAGLLARNANRLGLHAQAVGQDLAGAGLEGGRRCTWRKPA